MNECVSVWTQTARLWTVHTCICTNTLTDERVQTKIHAFNQQQQTTTKKATAAIVWNYSQYPLYVCVCVTAKQRHSAVFRMRFNVYKNVYVYVQVKLTYDTYTQYRIRLNHTKPIYTIRTWEKQWTCLHVRLYMNMCLFVCMFRRELSILFERVMKDSGKMSTIPMQFNVMP